MATLPTRSFATIVQTIAAGMQGRSSTILTFKVGGVLRVISEGVSGILLWLQTIAMQVLLQTRAATCQGADLDSFYADFLFPRLKPQFATGAATFSRITAGSNAPFIPIGATVQTSDGTLQFQVTVDLSNPYYQANPLAGYTMPSAVAAITVPVQAVAVGSQYNVALGQISQLGSVLIGIDNVVNATAITNGTDGETDPAYRSRFVAYIQSLEHGTVASIIFSVRTLQVGAQATVLENVNYDGSANPGFLTVTVDDGSGSPPQSFMTAAGNAVNAYRAGSIIAGVFAPTIIFANIAVVLVVAAGFDRNVAIAAASAAITALVNGQGTLGQALYYARIAQTIMGASPGITNISGLSINGATADLAATPINVIKVGNLSVS